MKNNIKISNKPILIFPGGMPRSLEYLKKCQRDGINVIGASSLGYDSSRVKYSEWLFLPFITHADFDAALKQAILKYDIGSIYSPNPVVWDYFNRALKTLAPEIYLVNDSPVKVELSAYDTARSQAQTLINRPLPLATRLASKPLMSEVELAALYRHAELIPGMCDHDKTNALCAIAQHSTNGDIVEIGSWWGKSAFILARLARCYDIGKLLCVDPWTNAHLIQNDAGGLVDRVSAQLDADEALMIFEMNLLPYSSNHVNYLRMPSVEGVKYYCNNASVTTSSFGTTHYCGGIAILHIDGNHSYDAVKADIASWSGLVVQGGWIVVDDYIWPYGDGPQRAGDEYLAENSDEVTVAFVMGGALFIQL